MGITLNHFLFEENSAKEKEFFSLKNPDSPFARGSKAPRGGLSPPLRRRSQFHWVYILPSEGVAFAPPPWRYSSLGIPELSFGAYGLLHPLGLSVCPRFSKDKVSIPAPDKDPGNFRFRGGVFWTPDPKIRGRRISTRGLGVFWISTGKEFSFRRDRSFLFDLGLYPEGGAFDPAYGLLRFSGLSLCPRSRDLKIPGSGLTQFPYPRHKAIRAFF